MYEGTIDTFFRTKEYHIKNCTHKHTSGKSRCWYKWELLTVAGDFMNKKQWAQARRRDKMKRIKMRRLGIQPPLAIVQGKIYITTIQ